MPQPPEMTRQPVQKVLIANRGEIAGRIARGCRVLGIQSVAVFSEADATARHVRLADEAVCVGPAESAASYLNIAAILQAARKTGADAVHPGYGFLSENTVFAQAVQDAGLTWIGPPASVIAPIQSKTAAKAVAAAAGVPTAPAAIIDDDSPAALAKIAAEVGLPLLVKPQDGGGGKGMQKVTRIEDFAAAVAAARRIAASAFSSDRLFVERYVENARHVEVQVLGDRHGTVVHCFERECSLQRRHQKVIEESPCSILTTAERTRIAESGRAFAAQVGYQGAGTVEFLFDPVSREHYFLEMNTRLQVEHPVTEVVLGLDLVVAQLRIARGERVQDILGEPLTQRGHGIEVRVYAEDPAAGYVPQVGTLLRAEWPDVPFVRVDAGFAAGDAVPMHYDPMLAKIIAWGRTRNEAADRMVAALRETTVHGVVTNIPFLLALLQEPAFRNAEIDTGWLDRTWGNTAPGQSADVSDTAMLVLGALVAAPLPTGKGSQSAQPAQETSEPWNQLQGWRLGA
jgi:acetyl/propionyl-CoA carboxylase alpha subunit